MSENLRFTNMLDNLMSSDNSLRKDAENGYEPLPYEAKIMFLLQAIGNYSSSEATRQLAALLLRQQLSLSFKEIYPNVSDLVKTSLKIGLLTSIQQERVAKVRTKLCDVVAELARVLVDKDGNHYWPELHTFLLDSVNSPDGGLREGALHIFWSFPGIFGNMQHQVLPVIKCMLVQCMQDQTYPRVRYAAARATLAFVLFSGAQRKEHNENSKNNLVIKHLTDMLPAIVQQLNDSCYQGEDLLLTSFVEIADKVATYLEPNLEIVLRLCLKLNADVNLRDVQRQMAMEVIVTLSETAAATLRNHTDIVTQSISQVLAMMVDLEENDEWLRSDELEEEDCHSNATSGESALDRLARGLGGTMVLPIVERHIFQMLQTPDWKYRHAGLMALSAIGEGCHQQMDDILDEVLNSVLVFCADDHPRVCYAACNALGRLATDFSPSFQKKFHDRVIPTLLQNLVDQEIPRVQAQAAAALVNFTDGCPKSIFTLYLEPLMPRLQQVLNVKLQELIQKGNKMVLEQVVILIASAAETVGKTFSMYYDLFMPQLTHIVENALHLPLRVLRGKTIESISVVGVAVGKEKFFPDASAVMELLLKSQTESNDLEDDDPQAPYMISAWARMCEILGKEFSKYLPLVMGPLMKAASIKPEVFDYARLEEISEDDNWECFNVGDENLAIRTASLEEKTTGCQMLVCYAKELKEGFVEYTEPVVKLMVPFLRFQFHEGVRVYAAQSLPLLLECAGCRGREYVTQMWLFMCDALMAAILSEPDLEVLPDIMVAFAKCVEMMGSGSLSDEQFDTLGKVLRQRLEVGFKEQDLRQLKRQSHTYDDRVEETLQEEEEIYVEILIRVSDIMYSVFLSYRESILPWFEKLLDVVVGRVSPHRFWGERMLGLCVFDYVIEYCSPTSYKYAPLFLKPMLESLCDSRRDVRQAASHAVGVMAQHGGKNYRPVCTEALPRLIAVIQAADSEKSGNATDNCVSAIGKIMRFRPECTNVDEILPHWLGWLPLKHDKYEATHMLDFLCELIEGNNPIVLGEDASNLPNIVLIFADGVENEMIEKECCGRIAGVIRRIQSSEGLWSRCVSCLNEIQRAAIDNLLSAARA